MIFNEIDTSSTNRMCMNCLEYFFSKNYVNCCIKCFDKLSEDNDMDKIETTILIEIDKNISIEKMDNYNDNDTTQNKKIT